MGKRTKTAADHATAACGGDAREAVKALLIANEFLESEMAERVSQGYVRGVKHGRFSWPFGLTTETETNWRLN
ncbi:MAG TPA: hypothetical protein DEH75_23035 [Bradyrhizobium sp.]|nr:hypothetical protein [Bradyrhizobium sp.]HAR17897.1 hypothetical protein [Bradyrhizobium sp.]HAR28972.1 hypothetical protein [Bradyrhizobium sp.]HBY29381.1 hypothetical protein [Bradyrhizobium sp.]